MREFFILLLITVFTLAGGFVGLWFILNDLSPLIDEYIGVYDEAQAVLILGQIVAVTCFGAFIGMTLGTALVFLLRANTNFFKGEKRP